MAKLPNIIEKERTLWSTIFFVFKESFKASKKYSLMQYVAVIGSSIFIVAQFGAFGIIVNEFVVNGVEGARFIVLLQGFLLLIVTQFGPNILNIVQDYAVNIQMNDISRHLQTRMFEKTEELDIGTIEQPKFQNICEISNNHGWGSYFNLLRIFTSSISMVTRIIVSLVALLAITPVVFIIIFIGALPTYFLERKGALLAAKILKENSEQWRMWRIKTEPIQDKDPAIELKNFGLVKVFKNKFLQIINRVHSVLKKNYHDRSMLEVASDCILLVSYGIAFIVLINNVQNGLLAVGSLVFAFGLVTQFQGSLNTFFSNLGRMAEHKKNVDVMLDLFEMQPMVVSGDRQIALDEFATLEIKNVSFGYPNSPERMVIQNLSLTINRGDNLAIVGLNGAGKTTLIKLITRVYDPTEGDILVNGINLKEYDLKSWKHCMGILLQEYTIYAEETIAENIMLGDITKHDQSIVEQSAQDATAHGFIQELPEQYEQRVGTEFRGGVELSKGQKQKLALARVLYRRAPIIILDEPTAATDALSEDAIFKNLKDKYQDHTRIIISHKFSNVRDADKIILIEHGRIVEQGNHAELIKKQGNYAKLFALQAEGYK